MVEHLGTNVPRGGRVNLILTSFPLMCAFSLEVNEKVGSRGGGL